MSNNLDLGDVNTPLFVFGGPYSNLAATRRVLEIAEMRGISPENIVCTGDVVAYCAHPSETVELVRDAGIHVVMGNCEESLGKKLDGCGCGFDEGSACDVLSSSWFTFANSRINNDQRHWMRKLPHHITGTIASRTFTIVHGHSGNISGWVFASTPPAEKKQHFDTLDTSLIIGGHCGLPFIDQLDDGRVWLNAGVVGMPANDGTPRGWYAVLTPEPEGDLSVAVEPFDYQPAEEIEAMSQHELPIGYRDALVSGKWPNLDVLPTTEQQQYGIPLNPLNLKLSEAKFAVAE